MASLKERGGKWYAQYYDKDGKQCRYATGISVNPAAGKGTAKRNKAEAQRIADAMEQVAKGRIADESAEAYLKAAAAVHTKPSLTACDYLTRYEPRGGEQNRSNVRRAIALFLDFLTRCKLDDIALAEVKKQHCEAFLGEQLREHGLSSGTVDSYKNHLARAFKVAIDSELLNGLNPFARVKMSELLLKYAPERKGKDKTKREPFTAEEMRRILTEFPQPYNDLAAVSFYAGGQRIGDCIALTWAQVDFERGFIHFRTQKTGKELTQPLLPELRRRLEARRTLTTDKDEPQVFPELARQAERSKGTISTQFSTLLRAFGIVKEQPAKQSQAGRGRAGNPKTFHSIRHAAVSLMRAGGVPADVSRAVVGHDSEAIERVYFTAPAEAKYNALSVLADAIRPADASSKN